MIASDFFSIWYSPAYFLALLLPLLIWLLFHRRRDAIRFSDTRLFKQLSPSLRQRLLWLPNVLTLLAILFLILGLARPREGRNQTVSDTQGIAIELVVDRSGSMRALDFRLDGEPVDRLTAIKHVAGKFVLGDKQLAGRFSDLVGLVTFAGYADGQSPPTLDHAFLVATLNQTRIAETRQEDGTAMGDALALAVEKLTALDEQQPETIQSKIIILLTDGENNAGELDPIQAAELAQTLGIKVYTIGVGTRGQAPVPVQDPFTGRRVIRYTQVNLDEPTLQNIADITGGNYYRATDTDSLKQIYAEIDQLETTEIEARHLVDFRELAVQPYPQPGWTWPPLLLVAFVALLGRVLLENTWLNEVV